jgi:3-dehydroquinate synthase
MMNKFSLHIDNHKTSILIGRGLFLKLDDYSDRKLIFLVDENVYRLNESKFFNRDCIIIPQGEKQKTLSFVESVFRKMVELEVDRTSFLVGIGGGLVTDLAGFVASTYMRGIEYGFISSTLLGQVDASIGGKNGVNLDGFKNMIGVIRQPEFVWCDLDLLQTLEHKELVSGFSEVIKYGAIRDKKLFDYLEENHSAVLNLESESLKKIVSDSASIKVQIVESDVFEKGDRKILNFGHTLGHAIEKLTGMLHGEAVAIGMVLAARLSMNLGFLKSDEAKRLQQLISASGLPVSTNINPTDLYSTLLKDKKRAGNFIHFILLKSIGNAFVHEMKMDTLKNAIHDLY